MSISLTVIVDMNYIIIKTSYIAIAIETNYIAIIVETNYIAIIIIKRIMLQTNYLIYRNFY